MEGTGSGSVQIITDPDLEGPKTYGSVSASGSGVLCKSAPLFFMIYGNPLFWLQ
jgi:hypothetical protein